MLKALLAVGFSWPGMVQPGLCVEAPVEWTVDFDRPPRERWQGAVHLVLQRHAFEDGFLPAFAEHNESLYNSLKPADWQLLGSSLRKHWPEQAEELAGISDAFAAAGHHVSFEYLAGWTYFHELAHSDLQKSSLSVSRECTGILVKDASGHVLHGANMDQTPESVRNMTLEVTFTRGNRTLFRGVDWYWFTTGVTRAIREGSVSVQENWRHTFVPLDSGEMLKSIAAGVVPHTWVFRQELQQDKAPTFDGFVEKLKTVPLAAPFYVVAAGAGKCEGVVFARSTGSGVAGPISRIGGCADAAAGEWFLVQSNYDHWQPDNIDDPRRSEGERVMKQLGQQRAASLLGLYAALSDYPVHNPHTVYTALMNPSTGEFHTYVRRAMCPEDSSAGFPQESSRYCQKRLATAAKPTSHLAAQTTLFL
eukprot:TRINITY_DN19929_c0_g1_i1.p1 TRINITY_DN19929_c0_g1~~TRINITY_DN19929_c0_g1_i1.p1  ORF type:complete len:420 (+),score=79.09 TRINITY_DN19929_c0_g1_i1:87-1346(+)